MNLSEYANLDAVDLARLVAKGDVRPAELAALALEAADAVNPAVNAVVEQWAPEEADLATATSTNGPLAGVPFLIKDLAIQMSGRRCELGSRLAEGLVAADDSLLMRHYRRAGLVTVGRTTTPEMAFSTETESVQQGATRNPWNLTLSAGGSSGGSGAAVAAGIVPIAHATDAAGSIRIPAAYNGLFGLKPTRGRTSNGPALDEVFGGLGVQLGLSRCVRDSAALMDAVQGYSRGDPYYTPAPAEGFLSQVGRDPGRLRIGLMLHPWNGAQTAAPIAQAARDVAVHLQSLGHRVEEVAPALGVSWEAFVHANAQIWCATLVRWIDGLAAATGRSVAASTLEPSTLANYRYGQEARAVDFAAAFEVRNTVSRAVGAWFDDMDVLMTPTLPEMPGALGNYSEGAERMSGLDWTARVFRHTPFTPPANVAGTPAMSVPLCVDPDTGLPIGIQFMASFAREDLLLRLAGQLEQTMPWAARRPAVWAGAARAA